MEGLQVELQEIDGRITLLKLPCSILQELLKLCNLQVRLAELFAHGGYRIAVLRHNIIDGYDILRDPLAVISLQLFLLGILHLAPDFLFLLANEGEVLLNLVEGLEELVDCLILLRRLRVQRVYRSL